MEYFKYLHEVEASKERRILCNDNSIRLFAPIVINDYVKMSIQASAVVSSKPQETLHCLDNYTHMEVAFFNNDSFAKLEELIPYFPSIAEFETYHRGEIYESVPVDLIDEVFQYYVLKRDERIYG